MPEVLQPDQLAAALADFDRRLRNIETSTRVGLGGVRTSWSASIGTTATYGAWETSGGGLATHRRDNQAGTFAGYPFISMTTPSRVLAIISGTVADVGASPFRANQGTLGLSIDGAAIGGGTVTVPFLGGIEANNDATSGTGSIAAAVTLPLTPGVHTFQIAMFWTATGGAGAAPYITSANLVIIPIAAA
jgi:hypothetical protein